MTVYDMIYEIDYRFDDSIWFGKIEGVSVLGDVGSNAYLHPIQYIASTKPRPGDDEPFEGVGWTPSEAIRNLHKTLKETFNK